jgi:4-diphosphocytidyl-2-C-methyl-D-erythritol kinase
MPRTLTLLSPAKLNLFLHITGRRPDGYHELQTLFQLLDWGDEMVFEPNDSGQVTLECAGIDIAPRDNLVLRAAGLLRQDDSRGARIRLSKRVPVGGGLGGGSSNAATTLMALNHLWGLDLVRDQLAILGRSLGADVPVFIGAHSAWAEGVGEILTPVELPTRWYLILAPQCHVSTAEIFSHRELTRNTSPIKIAAFFQGHARNDCQELVRRLYPEVDKALKMLDKFGAARMTGTGACVFTDFDTEAQARAAADSLPSDWQAVVARGINKSPLPAYLT